MSDSTVVHKTKKIRSETTENDTSSTSEGECKLFVRNLSWNTTKDSLEELFVKYGTVEDCHVAVDRDTGRPRGFAFVTFSSHQEALDAVAGASGVELDGREISVEISNPGARGGDSGGRGGGRGRGVGGRFEGSGRGRGGGRDFNGRGRGGNFKRNRDD